MLFITSKIGSSLSLSAFLSIIVVSTGSPVSTFVDAVGLPTNRSVAFPIYLVLCSKLSCNFITKWRFWQWGRGLRNHFQFVAGSGFFDFGSV